MDFSNLLCQSCYIDLSKLLHGFIALWQTKPSWFGHDFKVCWSFCFEIKVLNESKYLMPGVRCAFGNVVCSKYFTSKRSKGLSGSKMWHRKHSIIIALRISHFFAALKSMFQNLRFSLWQTWYVKVAEDLKHLCFFL